MPAKEFILDDNLSIWITKRKSSRRIRLSIANDGRLYASLPRWLPYSAAIEFANSKKQWIISRRPTASLLEPNRQLGKGHHLVFKPSSAKTISSRLNDLEAIVYYPDNLNYDDPNVQAAAKRVVRRALNDQATKLLPLRLEALASEHCFKYRDLRIKSLKSRWGSCDSHGNITLNLYLMDLPWELIDYVLLHELNHTKVMQHGPKFWQALEKELPNYLALKKQLKGYPTII